MGVLPPVMCQGSVSRYALSVDARKTAAAKKCSFQCNCSRHGTPGILPDLLCGFHTLLSVSTNTVTSCALLGDVSLCTL